MFNIYNKCYACSLERFRQVTKEDLFAFKTKYLKPSNITERDFEKLLETVIPGSDEDKFKNATYKPLQNLFKDIYVLESCPPTYSPKIRQEEEIPVEKEIVVEKFVKEEEFLKIKEEVKELKMLLYKSRQLDNVEMEETTNEVDEEWLRKLNLIFKENKFTARQALTKMFTSSSRPTLEVFESFTIRQEEKGFITRFKAGTRRVFTYFKLLNKK